MPGERWFPERCHFEHGAEQPERGGVRACRRHQHLSPERDTHARRQRIQHGAVRRQQFEPQVHAQRSAKRDDAPDRVGPWVHGKPKVERAPNCIVWERRSVHGIHAE